MITARRHGALAIYAAGVGMLFGVYVGVTSSIVAIVLGIACMAIGAGALASLDNRAGVQR